MSSVKADITEDAGNPMRVRTAKRTSDNKAVAPLINEDRRLRLQVSLLPTKLRVVGTNLNALSRRKKSL